MVQLQPFSFVFYHVTGHQDRKSEWLLILLKQLNIDCDAWASKMPPPPNTLDISHNTSHAAGFPHLCINNQIAIQCLQHTLHDAATQGMYFQYLISKFQWTINPATTIHWQLVCLTLSHKWCILSQFIHEWLLPLQDHHHVIISTSSEHGCPSCQPSGTQNPSTLLSMPACGPSLKRAPWLTSYTSTKFGILLLAMFSMIYYWCLDYLWDDTNQYFLPPPPLQWYSRPSAMTSRNQ